MYRAIAVLLFCAGILCLHQAPAQVPMTGAGHAAPGYVGPLNIAGSAAFWYSTRCPTAAFSGNLMDVWDSATGSTTETKLTCSAGGNINQTVNPLSSTCSSGCVVATWYDLSGAAKCNGAVACDLTQATNANRAAFTQNCVNTSLPCVTYAAGTQGYASANNIAVAQAQPITCAGVSKRTGTTTVQNNIGSTANGVSLFYDAASGEIGGFAGTLVDVTGKTENAWHSTNFLYNGAGGIINVDGTAATSQNMGSTGFVGTNTNAVKDANNAGHPFTGTKVEWGCWPSDQSANFAALIANQRAYYNAGF